MTESGVCKFYYHCNMSLGPINFMNIYGPHLYTIEYYLQMGNGWVTSQVLNEMEQSVFVGYMRRMPVYLFYIQNYEFEEEGLEF